MRVNNRITKAALVGKGFLSASITISAPENEMEAKGAAFISGFEFGSSYVSKWRVGDLSIGDKIEIEILPGDDADPPTETQRKADVPMLLFSDADQTQQALAKMHVCNEHLQGILQAAKHAEPHEALKIQRAVAQVVQELSRYLIMPTLRRHPELTSEAKSLSLLD
jgi:hypothetical protein